MKYLGNNQYQIQNAKTGQTKTVSGNDLGQYGIALPYKVPTQPQSSSLMDSLADFLPMAGGVAGNIIGGIGGGIAGTAVGPEGTVAGGVAGGIALGGIGQGIGEAIKEMIRHQPLSGGEIAKQGVIGGLFSAIPGGEEAGTAVKIAIRAIGGGVASAAAQGIEDIGKQESFPDRISSMLKSGAIGAIVTPILGGAFDTGASVLKFIGEKIPGDIYETAVKAPAKLLDTLHKAVQATMVGHDNVEYAIGNGIIPQNSGMTTDVINSSLDKAKTKADEVEASLQNEFEGLGKDVGVGFKQVVSGTAGSLKSMIDGVYTKMSNPNTAQKLWGQLMNIAGENGLNLSNSDSKLPLGAVNDMKRTIGEMYNIPGVSEIYNQFKIFIEKASGEPEKIMDLNDQASKLIQIKTNLKNWKYTPGTLPDKFTPEGIADAVKTASKKNPVALKAIINTLGFGLFAATGGMIKDVTGALTGMALMFGLRNTLNSAIDAAFEGPEMRIKVADILSSMYENAKNMGDKFQIQKALQQIGIQVTQKEVKGN